MPGDLSTTPLSSHYHPYHQLIDETDMTLGASAHWLGTRIGAGGTANLAYNFFGRSPWLHGQQD